MPARCCVDYCRASSTENAPVALHRFPRNEHFCQAWREILQLGFIKLAAARVCGNHFSVSQYDNYEVKTLKANACPDLLLPTKRDVARSNLCTETMDAKLYQRCCRICMDDTKEQIDVLSDGTLAETLLQLYNVKVDINDRITKKICLECVQEANETQKWLKFYEEQKKLIAENQRIYNEELVNQLGPERTTPQSPAPSTTSSAKTTGRSSRTRLSSRRILDDDDDDGEIKGEKDDDFIPRKSPRMIKKESISTRSKVKQEYVPSSEGSGRESATTTTENGTEEDDASETGTSTSDGELKCPKCEKVFAEIDQLERHTCEFVCNICSASVMFRNSLKRHLITVHKIKATEWENYWNPNGGELAEGSLLVETTKPKKRYRYESDSPTSISEDSNTDENEQNKDLICSRCGDKFYSTLEMKNHDCDFGCNICGATFASRNSVKRHKVNVHKLDPNDPSLASRSRATSVSRSSRPPSRPPSRAGSDNSDDEPLAALASLASVEKRYRYFCPDCDYSSYKRSTITNHLVSYHRTPKEQIDVDAIPKKAVPRTSDPIRAKTPVREPPAPEYPKTPVREVEPTPARVKTPSPVQVEPVRTKTPDPVKTYRPPSALATTAVQPPAATSTKEYQPVTQIFPTQHRSRSRSIHQDSRNSSKRKRSLSSCSNKSSRSARARSNPPNSDRQVLTAKRRLSPSRALASVHEKFRPTVTGIQSNRLFVSIRQGCEPIQPGQQIRFRASSYLLQDSCPTKRLFKLRPPVGNERRQVQNLRGIFSKLSHQISTHSKVNEIDVDSLVLDYIHPPAAVEPPQDPLNKEATTFEILEVDSEETTQVVVVDQPASVPVANSPPPVPVHVTGDDDDDDAEPPLVIDDDHREEEAEDTTSTSNAEKQPEVASVDCGNGKDGDTVEPMEVEVALPDEDDPFAADESPEGMEPESSDVEQSGQDEDVVITPDDEQSGQEEDVAITPD